MQEKISLLAKKIKAAGKTVAFTGAGISTESGIPDYRSQGGIWEKFRPVYFDEFMTSRKKRQEYWQRWKDLYQGIVKAAPNPAHLSLARLYAMGLLEAVVTQNVDGLHQAAGVPPEKVIELHGTSGRRRTHALRPTAPPNIRTKTPKPLAEGRSVVVSHTRRCCHFERVCSPLKPVNQEAPSKLENTIFENDGSRKEKRSYSYCRNSLILWCRGTESNCRHGDG